jgi:CheY-like chemotaxis protein
MGQGAGGGRLRVLVVEDDGPTREAMGSWFTFNGYSVTTAANGREAIPYLDGTAGPIDVAVLDVDLPDLDGVHLCDILHRVRPSVPVVVYSGAATPSDKERMKRLGARQFLRKPMDPDELLSAVEKALP